jgi:peptide deformylase
MKELEIARVGNPVLRKRSRTVLIRELKSEAFQVFLDKISDICIKNNGVGIAAPQVSVSKRVIIVHIDPKNSRYKNKPNFPLTIVINPKIILKSKETNDDWEGDLSCDLRAIVPRSTSCIVQGLDRKGTKIILKLEYPFHARVFQHEIDHLNGVLLLDRVKKKETICELAEYKKYWEDSQ